VRALFASHPELKTQLMTFRIGIFFLLLGLISLFVFFASDFSQQPIYWLFFVSLGLIFLGIMFARKGYTAPPPSDRFRTIRKLGRKKNE
jgi:hypothetical protein